MTDESAASGAAPALLVPDDPDVVDGLLSAAGFDPAAAVRAGAGTLDAALPLHNRHRAGHRTADRASCPPAAAPEGKTRHEAIGA
ncbi:hypothetical protein GCM10010495_73620 [Kitasatospora herbaricolor]|uniref:hypothetical protein n=1 Tax=Kitasatospora herbaricolor TaxID=68217 RepID=UPI00174C9BDC|nr:hypothetical protein [Kitasatospora herbaricolor]MDQ0305646.1 hypothetical protein [Kitasatospora herbaricolor]GGV45361.1 hypothetical protein GCM10010495_73620 [Kitasatospora herbaricolor]